MNKRNLVGLLGMCRRAGRLTTGFDAVVALCEEPTALLLTAENASPRTVKELRFHAKQHPVYVLPLTKEEIADAIGSQKPVAVLATADVGFADALRTYVIGGIPL
jgi:ribosomal protein L7Ae-like RNA K-turn-binding protein